MNENINKNLICTKCGNVNNANINSCIHCGNQLVNSDNAINAEPLVNSIQAESVQTPHNMNYNITNNSVPKNVVNYKQFIIGSIIKPFDNFKDNVDSLSNTKNLGIISLILIGFMTLMGLLKTIINAVRVTSFWTGEVEWVWENLEKIEYLKVIVQNILIYAGVLLAISGIYFLASLVIKKETKFPKLLVATVTAFIPFAIATSILSPLLSLIYSPLGICITVIGTVYTLVILLELMNELIKIENKNTRIYFHLTCLSILIIGGGFIAYKLILGSLSSVLGGLSSLYG